MEIRGLQPIAAFENSGGNPAFHRSHPKAPVGEVRNKTRVGIEKRTRRYQTPLLGLPQDRVFGEQKGSLGVFVARGFRESVDGDWELTPRSGADRRRQRAQHHHRHNNKKTIGAHPDTIKGPSTLVGRDSQVFLK